MPRSNKQLSAACETVISRLWSEFRAEHDISVDRLVCFPKYRNEFLSRLHRVLPTAPEGETLWWLLNCRKRKELTV